VDLVALGQPALAGVGNIHAGDVLALEHDPARSRRHLASEHLEERALARSIGADDPAHLALFDGEVDVAVRDHSAVVPRQADRLEDGTLAIAGPCRSLGPG